MILISNEGAEAIVPDVMSLPSTALAGVLCTLTAHNGNAGDANAPCTMTELSVVVGGSPASLFSRDAWARERKSHCVASKQWADGLSYEVTVTYSGTSLSPLPSFMRCQSPLVVSPQRCALFRYVPRSCR